MSEFSKRLVLLRKAKGLSQRQVAGHLEISQPLLSHYEKGVREPNFAFLAQVANYYDVSTDYLLGLSDTAARPARADDRDSTMHANMLETVAYITQFVDSIKDEKLRWYFFAYLNAVLQKVVKTVYQSGLTRAAVPRLMERFSATAVDAYLNICLLEVETTLAGKKGERNLLTHDVWAENQERLAQLAAEQLAEADRIISLLV